MIFSNGKKTIEVPFKTDGFEIYRVSEVKFLGVAIDENLAGQSHNLFMNKNININCIAVWSKRIIDI